MKSITTIKQWLLKLVKTKPALIFSIIGVLVLLVAGFFVFRSGVLDESEVDQSKYTYLPDREYVLGEKEDPAPTTLQELLYSQNPSIDDLLKEPAIVEELLKAEQLTDIVDSRFALNSLRVIDEQLEERKTEEALPMADLLVLAPGATEKVVAKVEDEEDDPAAASKPYMPDPAPRAEREPLEKSERAKELDAVAETIDTQMPGAPVKAQATYETQSTLIAKISDKVDSLLALPTFGDWIEIPPTINLKGIWQNPGETLLHFVPEGDWVPEEGYKVYRLIGEEKVLISEKAASPKSVESSAFKHPESDLVREVYSVAKFSAEDQRALGMDEETFANTVYRMKNLENPEHISGEADFLLMKQTQITIPDGFDQKMPRSDQLLGSPIQWLNQPENGRYESGVLRFNVWSKFAVRQSELPFGLQTISGSEAQWNAAYQTLEARQQITTMSFVDQEFAEEAGFLIRDDLKTLSLNNGDPISYLIEAPGGAQARVTLAWGKELPLTTPKGFMGYGLDGRVSLRWRKPQSEQEAAITSGYFVERKLEGESSFKVINEKPIVISEILDESGVFFESPIMYQEDLENGTKAQYRIYSIDIFGRKSEPSSPIDIRVEKVTPPDAPTISSLIKSDEAPDTAENPLERALQEAVANNRGKRGVVIPIYNESPDTVRFTLYRAEAVGVDAYGKPIALANFDYDNPAAGQNNKQGLNEEAEPSKTSDAQNNLYLKERLYKSIHLFLSKNVPAAPAMVYFDSNVKEGITYKYWVSAWDSWNNESAWSLAMSVGIPTSQEPQIPQEIALSMLSRALPDLSYQSPGIVLDSAVSKENQLEYRNEPERDTTENTTIVQKADDSGTTIGQFMVSDALPMILSKYFDNLPQQRYFHMFIGVEADDILPDESARLRWPAYPGDDLGGYGVYQARKEDIKLEDVQNLSRDEILSLTQWTKLTEKAISQNQLLVQGLNPKTEGVYLFLVCLEPEKTPTQSTSIISNASTMVRGEMTLSNLGSVIDKVLINQNPDGGYVSITWQAPQDSQLKYFRVYRSEVKNFKQPVDEKSLEWTMVGDQIFAQQYTDPVEQSHAHYYFYKVTSVSPWGVESALGTVDKIRVPSTKPPQTPNILLPLSKKDGIQINFSSVQYASRYEVYRAEIPKVDEDSLVKMDNAILSSIFMPPSQNDQFLTEMLSMGLVHSLGGDKEDLDPLSRIKTVSLTSPELLSQALTEIVDSQRQDSFSGIIHQDGPLALADYRDLSIPMMNLVHWEKIAELPVDEDTEEMVDPATGLLKPLSIIDRDAKFGTKYLYTVQAWNDDELGSTRPEPVEATTRRNRPFDPIDGLSGFVNENDDSIQLQWNPSRMEGLTADEAKDDTVGYIVYYATKQDGLFVQASPLLFSTRWVDHSVDTAATNWYRVKVLDRGGYLSEFSEPILVRRDAVITLPRTKLPVEEMSQAPKITMEETRFIFDYGFEQTIPFTVTGSSPMVLEVLAFDANAQTYSEVYLSDMYPEIIIKDSLAFGEYAIRLTARNDLGEDSVELRVSILSNISAPVLSATITEYAINAGQSLSIPFSVIGTEPIRLELEIRDEVEDPLYMISLPADAREFQVPEGLGPGIYTLHLQAYNVAGGDYLVFTLEVYSRINKSDDEIYFAGNVSEINSNDQHIVSIAFHPVPRQLTSGFAQNHTEAGDGLALASQGIMPAAFITSEMFVINEKVISPQITVPDTFHAESGSFTGFSLRNISLSKTWRLEPDYKVEFVGTADLIFLSKDNYTQVVPVKIKNATFNQNGEQIIFTNGILYIESPIEFEQIGVVLSSMVLDYNKGGLASGFVRSAIPGNNLFGNVSGFAFEDAPFVEYNLIGITPPQNASSVLPPIKLDRLTIDSVQNIRLRLNADMNSQDLLTMSATTSLKAPLETLNNEGIVMVSDQLRISTKGDLNGTLTTDPNMGDQFLQLLVPGGSGLRIQASIVYENGVPIEAGWIRGRIILPFERPDVQEPAPATNVAPSHPKVNEMDSMMVPEFYQSGLSAETLNAYLIHYGKIIQRNGLLIVPDDPILQENYAYAEFNFNNWKGEGFMIESAQLTNVSLAEQSLSKSLQKKQAIIVEPSSISIDLDREAFIPSNKETQTPQETNQPFWVGMVIKGGYLQLPTAFIQTKDQKPIRFALAEGEMIYDLNGFNYQSFLYNPAGVPATFGSALGGFTDVTVFDSLLDIYANQINLEINAEIVVDLFNNHRVKVKLYTNKEDNEDGKAGQFLCSVAPTVLDEFLGLNTRLTIDGGFIIEDGMSISGAVELITPEIQIEEPMQFSGLLVPSKKTSTFDVVNKDKRYGLATLDKAVPAHMQGFKLAVRELSIEYLSQTVQPNTPTRLSLWGAVMLSDKIPLGSKTTDRIAINTLVGTELALPEVLYDQSFAVLDAGFDETLDVKGVMVPQKISEPPQSHEPLENLTFAGINFQPTKEPTKKSIYDQGREAYNRYQQGLIEFESENLDFGFLGSLNFLPVDTLSRFGFDIRNERVYFVIGIMEKEGEESLDIGVGDLKDYSGLVVNNMVVKRDKDKRLEFPQDKEKMKKLVREMEVDRTPDGKFAAAIRGTLSIAKLAEVRNLYFGFEEGPIVEAAGGLYLPVDVEMIVNPDEEKFKHVGTILIVYSHPERYFSFNMTLNEIDLIGIKVSGSLGFEFSPKLFGIAIGYPETLAGNVGIYRVGLGLAFRISDDGANYIKGKFEFGFERSLEISIVYLKGFLYAGADGGYYANIDVNNDGIPDGDKFILTLYLKGGLEGGIKVGGKKYNIISFFLDAVGTIQSLPPKNEWQVSCSAKVSYNLNLYLFSVSGSVSASFDTSF